MIRVALVDDHQIMRQGLVSLLRSEADFEVIGEASSAAEFYNQFAANPPDVAVLDINMPSVDGFDLAETILAENDKLRIVFLTSRKDPATLRLAKNAGASGLVLKDNAFEQLREAIREVSTGGTFFSEDLQRRSGSASEQLAKLSSREIEVLAEIGRGSSNKEIATRLGLSVHTIRNHRARLIDKLDIHSGPELARFALEHELSS